MAEVDQTTSQSLRNVTVNGKRINMVAHPQHHGFSMFDAPALRIAEQVASKLS